VFYAYRRVSATARRHSQNLCRMYARGSRYLDIAVVVTSTTRRELLPPVIQAAQRNINSMMLRTMYGSPGRQHTRLRTVAKQRQRMLKSEVYGGCGGCAALRRVR